MFEMNNPKDTGWKGDLLSPPASCWMCVCTLMCYWSPTIYTLFIYRMNNISGLVEVYGEIQVYSRRRSVCGLVRVCLEKPPNISLQQVCRLFPWRERTHCPRAVRGWLSKGASLDSSSISAPWRHPTTPNPSNTRSSICSAIWGTRKNDLCA